MSRRREVRGIFVSVGDIAVIVGGLGLIRSLLWFFFGPGMSAATVETLWWLGCDANERWR